MSKKKMYSVNQNPKKDPLFVGTIDMNKLTRRREGKVNLWSNPEIKGGVHKSEKDYDRTKEKAKLKKMSYDSYR